jgi:hypothetical protein
MSAMRAWSRKAWPADCQLNTLSAAIDQLNADFLFEIPDLPAE